MGRSRRPGAGAPGSAVAFILLLALVAPFAASGCAPTSPDGAVKNMLEARDTDDWNLFLSSMLPDKVRSMSDVDVDYRKKWLKSMSENISFDVGRLGFKVESTGGDNAEVIITGGQVSFKDPALQEVYLDAGKMVFTYQVLNTFHFMLYPYFFGLFVMGSLPRSYSLLTGRLPRNVLTTVVENISEQDAETIRREFLIYKTVRYKGRWYVDAPLEKPSTPF